MSKYYVYEYKHPLTNEVFYVGKGTGQRMLKHLSETKENTENYKKWAYIQSLRNKGLESVVSKVFETDNENDAYAEETRLIKLYGRKGYDVGGTLTNVCEDARPPTCQFRSLETRAKISASKKGKPNGHLGLKRSAETRLKISAANSGKPSPMLGKKHSSETKQKIKNSNKARWDEEKRQDVSDRMKGVLKSNDHKQKLSESHRGKKASEETKQKMRESAAKIAKERGKLLSEKLKGRPWSEARRAAQNKRKETKNMKFTIDKSFSFEMGHRVWAQKLEHAHLSISTDCACKHLHGHSYELKVFLGSDVLDASSMVTDFKNMNFVKEFVDEVLDHKFMIDVNDPNFELITGVPRPAIEVNFTNLTEVVPYVNDDTNLHWNSFVLVDFVPTSENICKYLKQYIQEYMKDVAKVTAVELWETKKSHCRFVG